MNKKELLAAAIVVLFGSARWSSAQTAGPACTKVLSEQEAKDKEICADQQISEGKMDSGVCIPLQYLINEGYVVATNGDEPGFCLMKGNDVIDRQAGINVIIRSVAKRKVEKEKQKAQAILDARQKLEGAQKAAAVCNDLLTPIMKMPNPGYLVQAQRIAVGPSYVVNPSLGTASISVEDLSISVEDLEAAGYGVAVDEMGAIRLTNQKGKAAPITECPVKSAAIKSTLLPAAMTGVIVGRILDAKIAAAREAEKKANQASIEAAQRTLGELGINPPVSKPVPPVRQKKQHRRPDFI